jgi:hypothetical protein
MTREEVQKILMGIQLAFPNYHIENKSMTIDMWLQFMSDFSYEQVFLALKNYIMTDTSGFAPSIGKLVSIINKPSELSELTEAEAWALVSKAIRNGAYHSVEEFEKLPTNVQKAVGSPNQLYIWATDNDYNDSVVMSLFQKNYRNLCNRQKEIRLLPPEMRLQMNERLAIE